MNKADLIEAMAEKTVFTKKDSELALNAILAVIKETLVCNEKIQLIGFGSFEVKKRAARIGRNPRNPEETIEIAEYSAPVFRAGKALKEAVNKGGNVNA